MIATLAACRGIPIGVVGVGAGVIQTYWFNPKGDPVLLFTGVGDVGHHLQRAIYKKRAAADESRPQGEGTGLGLVISVIAGVLMGAGFFGLVSRGMVKNFAQPEAGLMTPYTALVVFAVGLFVSNFIWNTIASLKPVRGEPVPLSSYFKLGSPRLHAVGILGGTIWNIGMALSLIASGKAGAAISYGLGQGATLVAALWGILIWKEFKGAPKVAHVEYRHVYPCGGAGADYSGRCMIQGEDRDGAPCPTCCLGAQP